MGRTKAGQQVVLAFLLQVTGLKVASGMSVCLYFFKDLFIMCIKYIVCACLYTRRGHQIPLQMHVQVYTCQSMHVKIRGPLLRVFFLSNMGSEVQTQIIRSVQQASTDPPWWL